MNRFLADHFEKLLAALAVSAMVLSVGWAGRQHLEIRAIAAVGENPAVMKGTLHVPTSWHFSGAVHRSWPKAPEQSAGGGWRYELFTPPVIYYHPDTHAFAVTPPQDPTLVEEELSEPDSTEPEFESFRLQLAGYFGAPGDYVLVFIAPGSPETLLARVGRRFETLGLSLRNFEVRKVPVQHDGPWPVYEVAGFATLFDERTGADVVLDSRSHQLDANVAAIAPDLSAFPHPKVANSGP